MIRHNMEIHTSNVQYSQKQTWTITDVIEENFAKLKISNKGVWDEKLKGIIKSSPELIIRRYAKEYP